jgi:HEAT repeat protein
MADPSPRVRKLAAEALSGVGPGLASVLDILAGALEYPQASARRSAASLFASAGPAAAAAVPALYGALRDEDAAVREEARRAIRAVRGQ